MVDDGRIGRVDRAQRGGGGPRRQRADDGIRDRRQRRRPIRCTGPSAQTTAVMRVSRSTGKPHPGDLDRPASRSLERAREALGRASDRRRTRSQAVA